MDGIKFVKKYSQKINIVSQIVLFLVYIICVLFMIFHHEVWIDEAQAWFVVKDLSLIDIFKQIQVEGHPALWYLIILPFAKLGFGIFSMQIICGLIMILATYLLIFKSSFDFFTKAAITLSPCYIYWLPVVARSYCLAALFLFLLAMYWKKQKQNPYIFSFALIGLANTHILMFAFCFVVFLFFLFENLKNFSINKQIKGIIPSILQAISFLAIYLFFYTFNHANIHAVAKLHDIPGNIFHFLTCFSLFDFFKFSNPLLYKIANINNWILSVSLIILLFKNDKKLLVATALGLLFQIYVYIFVIYVIPQRVGLTLLLVIFAYWVLTDTITRKTPLVYITKVSFILFFILSVPISINLGVGDYLNNFSYSKEAAEFIRENLGEEATVVGVGHISSIKAYIPNLNFYTPSLKRNYSFYEYEKKDFNPYVYKMTKEERVKTHVNYIVSYKPIKDENLTEIYAPDPRKFFYVDKYYIYKYNN